MYEELSLSIDDLSVCDPGNNLIDKNILTFFQNDGNPFFEPLVSFLKNFIEYIYDDPSSIFFWGDAKHYLPNLFHN